VLGHRLAFIGIEAAAEIYDSGLVHDRYCLNLGYQRRFAGGKHTFIVQLPWAGHQNVSI
jgi:hypothetical protein